MNPPFLVATSNATLSVFVFARAGFFADDFMFIDLLLKLIDLFRSARALFRPSGAPREKTFGGVSGFKQRR
jgi:hypothetical protein